MAVAIIVELLGDRGDVMQFNVADALAVPKGTILQITDNRNCIISAADKVVAGIAASEKVANDGQTTIGVYTNGIFDLEDSGAGGAVGTCIQLGGINTVKTASASADLGYIFGKRLATMGGGGVEEVRVQVGKPY